jgi:hypothetical protein
MNPHQPAGAPGLSDEDIAQFLHETYERLAHDFGYMTRFDTRVFDPASNNGRLMVEVCKRLREYLAIEQAALASVKSQGSGDIDPKIGIDSSIYHQQPGALTDRQVCNFPDCKCPVDATPGFCLQGKEQSPPVESVPMPDYVGIALNTLRRDVLQLNIPNGVCAYWYATGGNHMSADIAMNIIRAQEGYAEPALSPNSAGGE